VKLKYLKATVPSSLRRARRIAVPSRFVVGTLEKAFGVPREKMAVVRHGLQENIDAEITSSAGIRNKFELGDGPVLVYPAITHPHKNHLFLLGLLSSGVGEWADPTLRVVFAGSAGSAQEAVEAFIAEHQLGNRVVMPGRVSNADRNGLLAMADAMVFPSEYEGFGAPVIEAMKFGCPVICSDRGSLPEVVGDAGMVCSLDNAAWGRALDAVRVRREELVHSGRERARMFTAALSAADLLREYDTIVSKGKAAL
jgi:glycosyltransferase involved in cell wall biosynthesis